MFAIETELGTFWAHYSSKGLTRLEFPKQALSKPQTRPHSRSDRSVSVPDQATGKCAEWHALTVRAVKSILAGKVPDKLPPFDLSAGTEFQQKVWAALQQIAAGRTVSYSALAAQIGTAGGARAVGSACGANPIPLLIPCHRVLAANGALGGFSGGLDWKRRLLAQEIPSLELRTRN